MYASLVCTSLKCIAPSFLNRSLFFQWLDILPQSKREFSSFLIPVYRIHACALRLDKAETNILQLGTPLAEREYFAVEYTI